MRGTSPPKAVLSATGAGHNPTQGSDFSVGHEPTQTVLSLPDTSPLKPTPGIGEEGARSRPVRMRKIPLSPTGMELVNPTVFELVKPRRSTSVGGSGKRARKIGDRAGAAFAVLEYAIESGDEPKPPRDSCI